MPYGIEVKNRLGNVQFSSDAENLTVVNSGTVTNNSTLTGLTPTEEILCLNRAGSGFILGNHNSARTQWTNVSGTTVNYIKLRLASDSTENSAGTYGIRIFDAQGNSTTTYSSNFLKGQKVLKIIEPRTLSALNSGSLALQQDDCKKVYIGPTPNVFVSTNSMTYTSVSNETIYQDCFYFDQTNEEIAYAGALLYNDTRSIRYRPILNNASILVFKTNG